jgi:hypothetical protein
MATTKNGTADFAAATDQLKELNDRLVDAGKWAGTLYLDTYEKTVEGVTTFQQKLAEQSRVEGVQTVVDAQAGLTREIAKAQTAIARQLIA